MGSVKWKRSKDDYVDSHCGLWKITPNYWSCVRPQSFTLERKVDGKWKRVDSHCATQREAKAVADGILENERKKS